MKSEHINNTDYKTIEFSLKGMTQTLWHNVFTLVKANLCFILFAIPIITIPVAITSMNQICIDIIRDKKIEVFKTFVKEIKKDFFKSWVLFLAFGLLLIVSGIGACFYLSNVKNNWFFVLPGLLATVIMVIVYMMITSSYQMLLLTNLKIHLIIKNAALLSFLNIKYEILGSVISIALILVQLFYWIRLIPIIVTIGISLIFFFRSYLSLYGVQQFVLTDSL